jgi:hypothetical protein
LLSIGSLIDKGLIAIFYVSECLLFNKQGVIVARGVGEKNGLYKLETTIVASETCCVKNLEHITLMGEMSNMVDLWHKQLVHLNHRGVHYLSINSLVKRLPIFPFLQTVYEGCHLGKQHRERAPRSTSSCSNAIFDLIHSNVYGLLQVPSFGGKEYFFTFIDDFSHYTWVFFL